jgi:hypothetical protein
MTHIYSGLGDRIISKGLWLPQFADSRLPNFFLQDALKESILN